MDIVTLLQATLLGIVEGATEFLPVSSTGHLIVVADLLQFQGPPGKVFEVFIQLGAILAICWLYRVRLCAGARQCGSNASAQNFIAKIIVGTLPAGLLGLLFHETIKAQFFTLPVVAGAMIVGGMLIFLIEKRNPTPAFATVDDIPYRLVLLIGFIQALAVIPGVSRSGATIMGAMLLGVDRKAATEFSFFLAIPAITAAALYDMVRNWESFSPDNLWLLAVGFISAFFSALVVVRWLIGFVSQHNFIPFAWYRIVVGAGLLLWLL